MDCCLSLFGVKGRVGVWSTVPYLCTFYIQIQLHSAHIARFNILIILICAQI